jgi:hypothetical protein
MVKNAGQVVWHGVLDPVVAGTIHVATGDDIPQCNTTIE